MVRLGKSLVVLALLNLTPLQADAQTTARPTIAFNRWSEDWSVLANPEVPREPLDELKYIPLSTSDTRTYLSLGANVRERLELNDAQFGIGGSGQDAYLLSRLEAHSDLRIAGQVQIFFQLQSDVAPGKRDPSPVDGDRLGIEQAFVALSEPLVDGAITIRIGRQEDGFDLQRFLSVRDGPNVRQAYDGATAAYTRGPWRFIALYTQPVQNRNRRAFDDYSSPHLSFGLLRIPVRKRLVELRTEFELLRCAQAGRDLEESGQPIDSAVDVARRRAGARATGLQRAQRVRRVTFGRLRIDAGLRLEAFGVSVDAATAPPVSVNAGPRLGASFAVSDNFVIHANGGIFWSPPSAFEPWVAAGAQGVAGPTSPDYDLRPETMRTVELGLSWRALESLSLTVTGWGRLTSNQWMGQITGGSVTLRVAPALGLGLAPCS